MRGAHDLASTPTVYVGYSRALGSGVVGEVAATGQPSSSTTCAPSELRRDHARRAVGDLRAGEASRTLVAMLNLESTRPAAFHGQLELLETVADQIAGAIASAQLYEELNQRARLMEMMSEVSRTALEATDLEELLERMSRYIHERFPLELVSIVMYDGAKSS